VKQQGDAMKVKSLDHIVLTVSDVENSISFYTSMLGMQEVTFGDNRKALVFGEQKINLHEHGKEFEPKAKTPCPGSADLCFITTTSINEYYNYLRQRGVNIEEGPIQRTGAKGDIVSIYIRDPDENLIEISNYNMPDTSAFHNSVG
jgi:catechol 2,3-dioxygenase-like lactoylglutathione lyase family enzyme